MLMTDLYAVGGLWWVPYQLLAEREPYQSISHKSMPTWEEHNEFMRSHPYAAWYCFDDAAGPAGCVYLSRQREIGVGVLKRARRQGLGKAAVLELMRMHPGKFLANINEKNEPSAKLFKSLGFNLIQHTYEFERPEPASIPGPDTYVGQVIRWRPGMPEPDRNLPSGLKK